MNKLRISILRIWISKASIVSCMIVPLFLSSCRKPESDNSIPVAYADVSPLTGIAPLSTRIKGYGTDADGIDDIKLYDLNINGKDSTSNSPFDFVKVFNTPGIYNIFVVVTDSHGATSKSKVVTVNVSSVVYNAPVASLSVSSTSGYSPLNVRFKVSGTDKDNDISSYRLYLDGKVDSSSVPIDTSMTFFPGTHTVYADVVDKHKLSNATSTTTINITQNGYPWGQLDPLPKGKVNLFVYPDSTEEYNRKKTPSERNNYLEMIRASDITPTIPTGPHTVGGVVIGWACGQASTLFSTNCMDLGIDPLIYQGIINFQDSYVKMYDWYMGDNFDSIYVHRGTLKFMDSHKAPIFIAVVSPTHQLNFGVVGNSLYDGKSLDFIETMYLISRSNIQFNGELYPFDYPDFTLWYEYKYIDKSGRNCFAEIPVVKYNLSGGVLKVSETNPNLDVIMTRDTVAPIINVISPVNGKTYPANSKVLLNEVVTADTYRYGYYSFDGGQTKTAIRKKEYMNLIYQGNRYFSAGNYTLSLYAKNEFFMDASKTINFTVK